MSSSHTKSICATEGIGTNGIVVLTSSFLVAVRNASKLVARERDRPSTLDDATAAAGGYGPARTALFQ
eukprot:scaffold390432_cov35-Prasinocladus_malaysianus.AAC.2